MEILWNKGKWPFIVRSVSWYQSQWPLVFSFPVYNSMLLSFIELIPEELEAELSLEIKLGLLHLVFLCHYLDLIKTLKKEIAWRKKIIIWCDPRKATSWLWGVPFWLSVTYLRSQKQKKLHASKEDSILGRPPKKAAWYIWDSPMSKASYKHSELAGWTP